MNEINLKFIIVGDAGVGKTSLLIKYAENNFPEKYQTTIGVDFRIKKINRKGFKINIQILDTAGQERFHSITKSYFKNIDGLLLVFDLTDQKTFDNLESWIEKIKLEQGKDNDSDNDFKIILIGNKCDLKKQRVISNDDVINKNFGYPYFEASAKKGTNVMKAFEEMIDLILKDKERDEILEQYGKQYVQINRNNKDSKVGCC